jgi:hypothetical protein
LLLPKVEKCPFEGSWIKATKNPQGRILAPTGRPTTLHGKGRT